MSHWLASAHLTFMSENQNGTQTASKTVAEALPVGAPVRYEGSKDEFRGLVGTVTHTYQMWGEALYSIRLNLPGAGVQDLHCARRASLVAGDQD